MDYISMDVVGTCVSALTRKGRTFTFELENRRGEHIAPFHAIVRDETLANISEGDRVLITKAGFFVRNGINNLAVVEGSEIRIINDENPSDMDYISVDVVGQITSVPTRRGRNYTFELENKRGDIVSPFHVIVRDDSPIDVNEGDRAFITKAGFFIRNETNSLAVVEGSNIEVIRIKCNLGEEEV
jgi:hypothetical protein